MTISQPWYSFKFALTQVAIATLLECSWHSASKHPAWILLDEFESNDWNILSHFSVPSLEAGSFPSCLLLFPIKRKGYINKWWRPDFYNSEPRRIFFVRFTLYSFHSRLRMSSCLFHFEKKWHSGLSFFYSTLNCYKQSGFSQEIRRCLSDLQISLLSQMCLFNFIAMTSP